MSEPEIDQARETLSEWVKNTHVDLKSTGRWGLGEQDSDGFVDIYSSFGAVASAWNDEDNAVNHSAAVLIIGLVGNPEFLQALDKFLEFTTKTDVIQEDMYIIAIEMAGAINKAKKLMDP